jgi:hypothetical protein
MMPRLQSALVISSRVVVKHQKAARPRAVSIRVALAIGRSLLRGIGGLVVSGKAR